MKQQLTKTTTFFLFSCISIALICFLFPVKLNAAHYEINLSISDDLNASGRGYSFNTNTLTFSNGANIHTYTFIQTGATTVRFINFQTGVATTVTLNGININPMYMTLQGNAQLNLLLSGTNTANGMIAVVDPAKLTIDNAPGS
ncbi:MAG: hypothetical protein LBU83_05690, partial [Bacteroidales bacterium]|nr:hypothetical protein [Bacteroidales bacterium]